MINPEFEKFIKDLFQECLDTLDVKGVDYASSEDLFAKARQVAQVNGLSIRQVLCVFLSKHITTIIGGVSISESMRKRIIDAIGFLVLIEKWDTDATKSRIPQ